LRGLRTSNIRVIDRADLPINPSSPKKMRNLLLALFLGLFGGVGLAFVLEYLDNTVKSAEEVGRYTGLPTLGVVPVFGDDSNRAYGYYYTYGKKRVKKKVRGKKKAPGSQRI